MAIKSKFQIYNDDLTLSIIYWSYLKVFPIHDLFVLVTKINMLVSRVSSNKKTCAALLGHNKQIASGTYSGRKSEYDEMIVK
jgi:hypothetical protein